jgi:NAD(P)-dependent dehydrogenase (short-subunit alcohol dehydrogenase family)
MSVFDLTGRVAVVTGGGGTLGLAMARGLARAGASVALLGRRPQLVEDAAAGLRAEGFDAVGISADVLDPASLAAAAARVDATWGRCDVLLTAAGGNRPDALVFGDRDLFGLTPEAFRQVVELNLDGTLLRPGLRAGDGAGGKRFDHHDQLDGGAEAAVAGVGYGAAKAAVDNLTRWLAVHLAQTYGAGLSINAIAPGFFVGEQNRALLLQPDGAPTDARAEHPRPHPDGPLRRPRRPRRRRRVAGLDAARFVTGVVVPVDGGYAAFGGV